MGACQEESDSSVTQVPPVYTDMVDMALWEAPAFSTANAVGRLWEAWWLIWYPRLPSNPPRG